MSVSSESISITIPECHCLDEYCPATDRLTEDQCNVSPTSLTLANCQSILAGGVVYTFGQPASQVGALATLICLLVCAFVMTWTADLLLKHTKPNDPQLQDSRLVYQFPSKKYFILIPTRISAFAIMFLTMVVQPMMFTADAVDKLIFERLLSNDEHHFLYSCILAFILIELLSLILRPKNIVILNAIGYVCGLIGLFCSLGVGIENTTSESFKCWKESFYKPYGDFNKSISTGMFSTFAFFGVLMSNFFNHAFISTTYCVAKRPEKNRITNWITGLIITIMYLICCWTEAMPYACAKLQSNGNYIPQLAPSDFQNAFTGAWMFCNTISFIISTLLSMPVTMSVTRQCSIDTLPWHKWKNKYDISAHIWVCLLNVIAVAITGTGVSVQFILSIGALLGCIVWIGILPMVLDLVFGKYQVLKLIGYSIMTIFIIAILIMQFF